MQPHIHDHYPHQAWGVSLAALGPRSTCCARGAVPLFPPLRGDVSALTCNDRFCNRIASVKPLFLLWLMSQVDPKPSLATSRAGGQCDQKAAVRTGLLRKPTTSSRQFVEQLV